MKQLCFIFIFLLAGIVGVSAQECPHPSGCVTISREAAIKAVTDGDAVTSQAVEIETLKQGVEDMRKELNRMRVEFAEKSGENTALRQNAVSDRAIIEVLLKNVRPKRIGLINLF